MNNLWNKIFGKKPLADYKVGQTYHFNDPAPKNTVPNNAIPDVVFDRNAVMYSYGFDEKTKMYKVIILRGDKEIW